MNHPSIALLTDFGLEDNYVGLMKCVIAGICPQAHIIDLCHEVAPQNLVSAAYLLSSAAPYVPEETILVGVVDPGVGGTRRAVAIDAGDFICVGPDNGLFDMVLKKYPPRLVVELTNHDYHLDKISSTFHGRDIFAPVAGHLAAGVPLDKMGATVPTDDLVRLAPTAPFVRDGRVECHVIHVDRFGNLITNLTDGELDRWLNGEQARVHIDERDVPLVETFSGVATRQPLAYFGSGGQLEIAVREGSAARFFNAAQGDTVTIRK